MKWIIQQKYNLFRRRNTQIFDHELRPVCFSYLCFHLKLAEGHWGCFIVFINLLFQQAIVLGTNYYLYINMTCYSADDIEGGESILRVLIPYPELRLHTVQCFLAASLIYQFISSFLVLLVFGQNNIYKIKTTFPLIYCHNALIYFLVLLYFEPDDIRRDTFQVSYLGFNSHYNKHLYEYYLH